MVESGGMCLMEAIEAVVGCWLGNHGELTSFIYASPGRNALVPSSEALLSCLQVNLKDRNSPS